MMLPAPAESPRGRELVTAFLAVFIGANNRQIMCESEAVFPCPGNVLQWQPTFFDAAHKRGDNSATRADLLQTIAC